MADVQLESAVSAVVSAFHAAIENVKTLRNHPPRGVRNEHTMMEKWLQDTLVGAEGQISQRFSQYSTELGEAFTAGDDIALTKLSRVAILMQSGLVRSLQMAVQSDDNTLDLSILQEDAVCKKKDALDALDGLRDRLLHPPMPFSPISPQIHPFHRRPSIDSVGTHISSQTFSSMSSGPSGVLLNDERDAKAGANRLSPDRRSSSRRSVPQDRRRVTDVANPDRPASSAIHPAAFRPAESESAIPEDPRPEQTIMTVHSHPTDWDKIVIAVEPDPALPPASQTRQMRWVPPATSTLPPAPTGSTPAPSSPSSSAQSPSRISPSSSISSHQLPSSAPSHPPSHTPPLGRSTSWQTPVIPEGGEAPYHHRHNPFSFIKRGQRSNTNNAPPGTITDMRGRPSRENNYWGFCKSAWDIRVEPKKGLQKFRKEDGFHIFKTVWLCRTCAFQGDAFGLEKAPIVDPNVYTAANGIRYRWIFLAKSHAKKKSMEGTSYGCVFCVSEGKATGIFGNVETLMNHIIVEHGQGIREDIRDNNKCIVGRVASISEDFDVNIPPLGES